MWKRILALLALLGALSAFAVDANHGSAAELQQVKGIGPALSGRIVAERVHGRFLDWDDLIDRVSGIGPRNSARFSDAGLTVNGRGYGGASAPPAERAPRASSTDAGRSARR